MKHFEKNLHKEPLYHGRILNLWEYTVQVADGQTAYREVICHHGGVCIAALDEDDQLLMVRQFRTGAQAELLELPAGKLEPGENPEVCGIRELEEETGYRPQKLVPLARMFPTPAYCTEMIHIFWAQRLIPTHQNLDVGEFLTVEKVPLHTAIEMVLSGKIPDGKTQLGILTLAARRRLLGL